MRFKRMGHKGDHRLSVPMLSGGICTDVDPTLIADNELTACNNMEIRDGALTTRKALRTNGGPFRFLSCDGKTVTQTIDSIGRHPIVIDGVAYAPVISAVNFPLPSYAIERVDLVPLCADVPVRSYTFASATAVTFSMVVVPCDAERYGTPFLLFRAGRVYRADDETRTIDLIPDEELYAPLVLINGQSVPYRSGSARPNGVMYEGLNVLTRRYRAQFTSSVAVDGYNEAYVMPITLNGNATVDMEIVTAYGVTTVTMAVGGDTVTFDIGDGVTRKVHATPEMIVVDVPLPKSTVSGNVTVTSEALIRDTMSGSVGGATAAVWFGGTQNRFGGTRLFLGGFDKGTGGMGACVMWSDVDNPLYFPQNNFMHVGDTSQRVTALDKQGDMLVIFKEREIYYTQYVEGSVDADSIANGTNVDVTVSAAYFPLTQLSPYIGCDVPSTIAMCRDRLVWMNADGRVYTLRTATPYSERNVREIGQKIHRRLTAVTTAAERAAASAADVDGRYLLTVGRKAFVFDYSVSGYVYQGSYASDKRAADAIAWFEHTFDGLPRTAVATIVSDGADRAVVITTVNMNDVMCVRSRWYFEENADDSELQYTLSSDGLRFALTDIPVVSSFITKQYTFGEPSHIKRIKALFVNVNCEDMTLRTIVDGDERHAVRRISGDGKRMQLAIPGVKRCHTIAICGESVVPLAVRSLRLQYQYQDVTR